MGPFSCRGFHLESGMGGGTPKGEFAMTSFGAPSPHGPELRSCTILSEEKPVFNLLQDHIV